MINQKNHKNMIIVLCLILAVIFLFSINAGYVNIPITDVIKAVFNNAEDNQNLIVLKFRLPRMFLAMLVGSGFALSGLLLQDLTRNSLADPGLIGVNAGAMFFVFIVIFLSGKGFYFKSAYVLPFIAFLGSLLCGMLVYRLSSDKYNGANPIKMVLNGIAIQTGLSALMVFAVLVLDDTQYEMLMRYMGGSLWRANANMVLVLIPFIAFSIVILMKNARSLDAFSLGDELSVGIGLSLDNTKKLMLVISVLLAGACVAMSGTISFVGLIAPHIARRMFGTRHNILIPACALLGAILVLAGDTIGRIIIMPSEIPAGIMVAIIGAPYFITLLFKKER